MVPLIEFCNKYELSNDSLSVLYSQGLLSNNIYVKIKGSVFIDEDLLNRLYTRKRRIILYIQSVYYLLNEHLSNSLIGYMIEEAEISDSSWSIYFRDIFKIQEGIMKFKISKRDKKVFLVFRKLERRLKKIHPNFNVEDMLDKRMNNA